MVHWQHHWGIILFVAVLSAACSRSYPVKTDELTKLNRVGNWTSGQPRQSNAGQRAHRPGWSRATTRTRETSSVQFEQPDGEFVEVEGTADAEITVVGGRTYRFDHPVSVWVDGDTVILSGDGQPRMDFAFDAIEQVCVIQNPRVPFPELFVGQNGGGITIFKW